MPVLVLSREGFTIRIKSPDAADLAWLEENLVPGFQVDTVAPPSRLLTKNVDPRLHRTLLDLGPASPEEHVRCFSFDGHGGECTRWNATAATLYDAELDVFYRLNEDGSRVEVVTPSSRPSTRIALLRVVREFATHHLVALGNLQFHAAAVAHDGRGILMVGPKRAGKTSLLIHALGETGSQFIANDRAVVAIAPSGEWRLGGMPTVIAIRSGTIELLHRPGLVAATRWLARMTLAEALATVIGGPYTAGTARLSISPRQFCHAVDATPVASASLQGIVFPRVDAGCEGVHFSRLSPDVVGDRLRSHLLHPADTAFRAEPPGQAHATAMVTVARLQAAIPGVECILGRNAFSTGGVWKTFFERLDRTDADLSP